MDRRTFAASALATAAAGAAVADSSAPEARTHQGRVRGFARNDVQIFLGLNYGADTGPRRFLPPAPPPRWEGVRDATRLGQRAPQHVDTSFQDSPIAGYLAGGHVREFISLAEPMGENCLVLNVLTPAADRSGRPVLVYMHGGGFSGGSGAVLTFADRFVAEEDVVLVTVNHRLSALGFLYLGELSERYAHGNPGLLDLVAALQWVRDNVAYFGGDPDKVTIFGESGGGAKVSYMLSMPQARGLFRAAIIESAGLVTPLTRQKATQAAKDLLRGLAVEPEHLEALKGLPFSRFLPPAGLASLASPSPVVDGVVIKAGPWERGAPVTAADIPVIVGYCADEATLFEGLSDPKLFALAWPDVAPSLAALTKRPEEDFAASIAAYRETYPEEGASDIFFRMASIPFLGWNGRLIADAKSAQPAPVFFYRMEYDTGLAPGLRAFHTCELPLAVRLVLQPRAEGLSKQIAGAWAAFARSGRDPNHKGLPKWDRYKSDADGVLMRFNLNSQAGPDPEERAQSLLRQILGRPVLA